MPLIQDPKIIIAQFAGDLKGRVLAKAAVRAVNRTATSARAEASRIARETLKVSAADAKAAMTIRKAGDAITAGQAIGYLDIKGRPIPLVKFGARPKRVNTARGKRIGVTVNVKGTRKLVAGGFLATMPTGYQGVFKRRGQGRSPIRQLFSTSLVEIFRDGEALDRLKKYARSVFATNLRSELNFQLSKKG